MKGYLQLNNLSKLYKLAKHIWFKYRGKDIQWEVKKVTEKRSNPQNRYYWAVVIPMVADHMGDKNYDYVHEVLLELCAPRKQYVIESTGQVIHYIIRSSAMSVDEFREYIDRIQMEFAQDGCIIPSSDELIESK